MTNSPIMELNAKKRGFTIIELLVVIVVIGVLAGITIATYNAVQQRAYNTKVVAAANIYKSSSAV